MSTELTPPPSPDRGEQEPQTPPDSGECFNGVTEFGFLPCEMPVVEPARGEQVPTEPPDAGRCIDGITEFGFLPCEVEVAVGEPPVPAPITVTEVAVAPSPVQQLPETGMESTILLAGVLCVAVGSGLQRFMRRLR